MNFKINNKNDVIINLNDEFEDCSDFPDKRALIQNFLRYPPFIFVERFHKNDISVDDLPDEVYLNEKKVHFFVLCYSFKKSFQVNFLLRKKNFTLLMTVSKQYQNTQNTQYLILLFTI